MRPLEWALIQFYQCPCTKRKFKHTETRGAHAQRDNHLKRQQEGSQLQGKERSLRGNLLCLYLDLQHPDL